MAEKAFVYQYEGMSDLDGHRPCSSDNCGGREAQQKCSRCQCAWYCGKSCQKRHWPIHKAKCLAHAAAHAHFTQGVAFEAIDNYAQAVESYAAAAEMGHASAQYHLGECLMFGRGIEIDKPRAVALWKESGDGGNLHALNSLIWGRGK